jgi:hypothetical protein
MQNKLVTKSALVLAAAAAAVICPWRALADTPITSFTPGDLVVLRGGDSTNPDNGQATNQVAAYLDEFTLNGGYVGTLAVPSTGGTALTLPAIGDFQHQGVLNLSGNGQLLTFAGYQVAAGSADANKQAGADQPVIGVVGGSASTLSTSTIVTSFLANQPTGAANGATGTVAPYIRGAYTDNGTSFYAFGKFPTASPPSGSAGYSSGATNNGGLANVSGTGATATTTTIEGYADWRDIVAVNGQLYGGTGGAPTSLSGNHGAFQISSGEPTTNLGNLGGPNAGANVQLGVAAGGAAVNESASSIALLDVPGDPYSQNGVNTLYTIGDQSAVGISKYTYGSTGWVRDSNTQVTLNANNGVNITGLVATADPQAGDPNDVFLAISGSNGLYTYVDTGGSAAALPANAFTLVDSAPTNEAFYGTALAPGTTSVPEPMSLGLLAVGGVALLNHRRRNKAAVV